MNGIVTVCDEEYLAGTKVLFYSFIQHNPEFKGEFLVIHDHLGTQSQHELTELFAVRFIQLSESLTRVIDALVKDKPELKNRYQRFWSLDVFRLNQYENLLFLDSDILCRGSLQNLFANPQGFSACPDLSYYEGKVRKRISFKKRPASMEVGQDFLKTFNAGVFMVSFSKLSLTVYDEILNLLNSSTYEGVSSGHTDQYVLNLYFENKVTWLGVDNNYVLMHTDLIIDKTGITPKEALIWHYIRHPKPWRLRRILKDRLKMKAVSPYWSDWHKVYREVLKVSSGNNFKINNLFLRIISKIIAP